MTQFVFSKKNKLTLRFAEIIFGAASIASFTADDADIARTGVGEFTITLKKKLVNFIGLSNMFHGSVIDGQLVHVLSANMSTGVIVINTLTAGVAADPTTGAKLLLELKFNDTVSR